MNDFTLNPLHSFFMKQLGIVVTILGLITLVLLNFYFKDLPDVQPNHSLLGDIAHLGFVFGLFLIAFSKEKFEDERVIKIRGKATQFGFMMSCIMGLASYTSVELLNNTNLAMTYDNYFFITTLLLGVYNIYYHLSLYFDFSGNYSNNSAGENILKNKRFFIIYSLIIIVLGLLVYLF